MKTLDLFAGFTVATGTYLINMPFFMISLYLYITIPSDYKYQEFNEILLNWVKIHVLSIVIHYLYLLVFQRYKIIAFVLFLVTVLTY